METTKAHKISMEQGIEIHPFLICKYLKIDFYMLHNPKLISTLSDKE